MMAIYDNTPIYWFVESPNHQRNRVFFTQPHPLLESDMSVTRSLKSNS